MKNRHLVVQIQESLIFARSGLAEVSYKDTAKRRKDFLHGSDPCGLSMKRASMQNADEILGGTFLGGQGEICLEVAATLDRIERAENQLDAESSKLRSKNSIKRFTFC